MSSDTHTEARDAAKQFEQKAAPVTVERKTVNQDDKRRWKVLL